MHRLNAFILFLCLSDDVLTQQDEPQTVTNTEYIIGPRFTSKLSNTWGLHVLPFPVSWRRNRPGSLGSTVNREVTWSLLWPFNSSSWVGLAPSLRYAWVAKFKETGGVGIEGVYSCYAGIPLLLPEALLERSSELTRLFHSCLKHFVLTFLSCRLELEEPEMLCLSKYRAKSNSMFCDAWSISFCLYCVKDMQECRKKAN